MRLIPTDHFKTTKTGPGFVIGEITKSLPGLRYLDTGEQVAHFDGLDTLLGFLPRHMPTPKEARASVTDIGAEHEFGYDQALKIYRENPSRVRQFTEHDAQILGGEVNGLRLEYDVTGDILDIGRFLEGEPEVFGSLDNGKTRGKRVDMVVNTDWAADTSAERINHRAARITRLVDWLEAQNIRVQVTGISSNNCQHLEVIAKHYHETTDLNTIAVMGHCDYLRRLGFRLTEYSKTWQQGYGTANCLNNAVSVKPDLLQSDDPAEIALFIGNDRRSPIDARFTELETALADILAEKSDARTLGVLV